MGVDIVQWSDRRKKMYEAAKEYFRILQAEPKETPEQVQKLKKRLDELTKPFTDNVAYIAFLEQQRLVETSNITGDER